MRTRARAFSLVIKDLDTLRSPHGPCPPLNPQVRRSPSTTQWPWGLTRVTGLNGALERRPCAFDVALLSLDYPQVIHRDRCLVRVAGVDSPLEGGSGALDVTVL